MSKRIPTAFLAGFLLVFAQGSASAEDEVQSILSAGAMIRSMVVTDAVTTWLEHSTAMPCWELTYRLRIPTVNGALTEVSAGFSYFESNAWYENGSALDNGLMRIFLLEAPVGVESTIPMLGPFLLTGAVQVMASYRELGWVVSESGAIQMSDFTLGANGHWGLGIRADELRIFLLAELFAGIPIYGQTSYPSAESMSYDRWTLGVGASVVFELLMGPVFTRAHMRVCREGEVRFINSEYSIGVEGMFATEVRFGIELGVRL